ncbi:helix-turn-helix protein [Dysgonomonas alginatilytica]|uniref:Helix-turn-helix protein n=1 Tax=Dysgonomonas alginatilytica TaxID=1605892 RepID=A0A2V3PRB6_9BACT|nr:helix-turn-helix transcriptional regulator [Dysgonomonas alginatilytica]PXV64361.1 helix-turn-helix protein [Dysgonomonas alginatilytica]
MKERIKKIMDSENMTPARFADSLQIGRAVISHILNGRNNPSLDVITRILTQMPDIDSQWLLTGTGTMYKSEISNHSTDTKNQSSFPDLFSQLSQENDNPIYSTKETEDNKYRKENIVDLHQSEAQETIKERVIYKEAPSKKVKQIIIYYTDNTFEAFTPGQ